MNKNVTKSHSSKGVGNGNHGDPQNRHESVCARPTAPSTEQAIKWMRAVCGYPVKLTWLKAINLMEINDKKVWICVSTGLNGTATGYFSSVVQEISKHVAAFFCMSGHASVLVAQALRVCNGGYK
jgi:hypothetical protein